MSERTSSKPSGRSVPMWPSAKEHFQVLRRHWWVMLCCAAICCWLGGGASVIITVASAAAICFLYVTNRELPWQLKVLYLCIMVMLTVVPAWMGYGIRQLLS